MHNNSYPKRQESLREKLLNKLAEIIRAKDALQLKQMLDAINANQPLDLRTGHPGGSDEQEAVNVEIDNQFKRQVVAVAVINSNLEILDIIDKKWEIKSLEAQPFDYSDYRTNSFEVLKYLREKQVPLHLINNNCVCKIVKSALTKGYIEQLEYFFNDENRKDFVPYVGLGNLLLNNKETIDYVISSDIKPIIQMLIPICVILYAGLVDNIEKFFQISQYSFLGNQDLLEVLKDCDNKRIEIVLKHHTKRDQVDQMITQGEKQGSITPEKAEKIRQIAKEVYRDIKFSSNVAKLPAPEDSKESNNHSAEASSGDSSEPVDGEDASDQPPIVVEEEEVKKEEVVEVVEKSVPREELFNPWQEAGQKLGIPLRWGGYPLLKQYGKFSVSGWIPKDDHFSINHNSLLGNSAFSTFSLDDVDLSSEVD